MLSTSGVYFFRVPSRFSFRILKEPNSSVGACAEQLTSLVECRYFVQNINSFRNTGAYKPNKKPQNTINYIYCEINHPPSIIENIQKGIGIPLPTNSSNTEIFHEASKPYNNDLKQNGYKQVQVYSKNENVQDRRKKTTRKSAQENMSLLKNIQNDKIKEVRKGRRRKRKITWSNPPLYVLPTRKQILQNQQ